MLGEEDLIWPSTELLIRCCAPIWLVFGPWRGGGPPLAVDGRATGCWGKGDERPADGPVA